MVVLLTFANSYHPSELRLDEKKFVTRKNSIRIVFYTKN